MRIKQEELPTFEDFVTNYSIEEYDEGGYLGINEDEVRKMLNDHLKLHKNRIRYEYDQYQFFLNGYKNGSASISEVTNAHNEFLKLLE